jgi:RNA polymerase sigma-32 factor
VKLGTTKLQKRLFYGLNKLSAEEEVADGNITDRTQAISARLDADPQQVEEIITRLTYRDQSLDTPLAEDSEASFMDLLADPRSNPEDHVMEQERSSYVTDQVKQAIATLSDREQDIVRQRLMAEHPQTLEDLGKQYNISKERIRQIENNVKLKLRKALEGEMDNIAQ